MSLPETYKALVIETLGQKAVLRNLPLPKPGKNQILVKMEFSPLHSSDIGTMEGTYPGSETLPFGIGNEGSGVVAALGEDLLVPHKIGDKVHVIGQGTFGEYLLTESELCAKINEGLGMELASLHSANPFTVHYLGDLALRDGHKAAINTAGSSVLGKMMIRYFKLKGIKLINIVRRDDVIPALEKEGADYVLNSTKPDFEKQLKEIAEKEKATVCFEAIAGEFTGKVLRNMPNNSTLYLYGNMGGSSTLDGLSVDDFFFKNKVLKGVWLLEYFEELKKKGEYMKVRDEVYSLLPTIFNTPIVEIFPLDKVFEAVECNNKNSSKGKALLKLN